MGLEPDIIQDLQRFHAEKHIVHLACDRLSMSFETILTSVSDQGEVIIKNSVPLHFIDKFALSKRFLLQFEYFRLHTDHILPHGLDMLFQPKDLEILTDNRSVKRTRVDSKRSVSCSLVNPFDGRTPIVKKVVDHSTMGIAIESRFFSKLFSPGVNLGTLSLLEKNKTLSTHSGEVVYNRQQIGLDGKTKYLIGIRFL